MNIIPCNQQLVLRRRTTPIKNPTILGLHQIGMDIAGGTSWMLAVRVEHVETCRALPKWFFGNAAH